MNSHYNLNFSAIPGLQKSLWQINRKSYTEQVKSQVLNSLELEIPSIVQVADQLCISTRTLQRKLKNEGQTYRKIIDSIKMVLALKLELNTQYKTKDIAYCLGYCSSSSYIHARNKWLSQVSYSN